MEGGRDSEWGGRCNARQGSRAGRGGEGGAVVPRGRPLGRDGRGGVRNRENEKALSDRIRRKVGAAPEEKRRAEDDMDQYLLKRRRRMDRRLAPVLLRVAKRLASRNWRISAGYSPPIVAFSDVRFPEPLYFKQHFKEEGKTVATNQQ